MSHEEHGKPKELPRGRPTTGRDPVVAVRLPHEAIADVDRLTRALGLSSRSDAIRYMIMHSTASIKPRDIEGGLSLGMPTELRSIERKHFQIEVFAREPEKWRASIRRSDGSKVRVGDMLGDLFTTSVDTSTADEALQLARKAIDAGTVQ
jgi:Arc/MetJ-type ribon-helix-helix transcriptional regulator